MSEAHSRTGEFRKLGENLYRCSSNGVYYARFRSKGKSIYRSLKTTDRERARRQLKEEINKTKQDRSAPSHDFGRFDAGQRDGERRAPFGIVVGSDGATVCVHDAPRDRESYPDAMRFGRDERATRFTSTCCKSN